MVGDAYGVLVGENVLYAGYAGREHGVKQPGDAGIKKRETQGKMEKFRNQLL